MNLISIRFHKINIFVILSLLLAVVSLSMPAHAQNTAPVSGFAKQFASEKFINDANITILENGTKLKTRADGTFGPIDWPVGQPITLLFEKKGYRTTQSATMIVPKEGLNDRYHNISFQVFDTFTFYMLAGAMGKTIDENKCHVAATITGYHKTMDDLPQGEGGAIVYLTPSTTEKPFYLDIFKSGPLKDHTNPFTRNLKKTSEDGGILYGNLDPQNTPYTLYASKEGVIFNPVQFYCRKGMFVNLSPPLGPSVQTTRTS